MSQQTMTSDQHPIDSGFTPGSTAADVLAGLDLSGRDVVITGGHSGLGLVMTRALSAAGARVTAGARDPERARTTLAGIDGVEVDELDLMDPASITGFATRYVDSGRPLHLLLNNAGLPAPAEIVRDARGYEAQFATNHLGHLQLTLGLHPALRAAGGARVVNTTSGAQRFSDVLWDDPTFQTTPYDPNLAYAQSKTANVLFAVELDRRWRSDDIRGYAAHPGVVVGTGLNGASGEDALRAMGLIDEAGAPIIDPANGKKTPEQGAATILFAATSPLLDDVGGVYLLDCDVSVVDDRDRPLTADSVPAEVVSHSIDPDSARRLWELSERLLAATA